MLSHAGRFRPEKQTLKGAMVGIGGPAPLAGLGPGDAEGGEMLFVRPADGELVVRAGAFRAGWILRDGRLAEGATPTIWRWLKP